MKMIKYYLAISVVFGIFSFYASNIFATVTYAWISLSVFTVSVAYIFDKPSIFRKRQDGSIPSYIRWIFVPFLLGASLYNAIARRRDSVPAIQQITDDVFLACRLFPSDIETLKSQGVSAILDVTAEFDGLDWSSTDANLNYLNIPVLDHQSPNDEQLQHAIHWINEQISSGGKVVIHCALGRGRSVLVTAAYLLSRDGTLSIVDAMNHIQSIRKTARLNKHQLKALQKVKQGGRLKLHEQLTLIANPIAGGGKWKEEKEYILERLETHYKVTVLETTPDISAASLAEKALSNGASIVIACGGDGTLSEVAEVICHSNAKFGIIPLGTANALSMVVFGTASKLAPISTACDVILAGQTTTIDTGLCNQKRFLLVCALGIEANMIKRSDREAKNEKGQLAYLQHFFESMIVGEPSQFKVSIDQQESQTIATNSLVIANAAPPSTVLAQGGGNPDITDGLLDVTYINGTTSTLDKVETVAGLTLSGLLNGQHSELTEFKRCKSITVRADELFDYVLDGEVFQDNHLIIECEPKSLHILCANSTLNDKEDD